MKTCEILAQLPTSGEYEEVVFGKDSGTFTRVKFSEQSASWVGVFQNGYYPSKKNQALLVADYALVLVGGLLYLVDLQAKTAQTLSSKDAIQSVIADEKQIFAAAFTFIEVFDYNGSLVKSIEGYYFDMFDFQSITTTEVAAQYYQAGGSWTSLRVDRRTLEISGKQAT